eukprot:TRINITY_DN8926_c0_g1_i1.p1 TRINITY_DN8926_c0_g1~~TRINITY_DN8926_c0_g1_i1.p1  ORF type:complete len:325 (+),score=28.23 TRINITY_DN8926_c0_g1_i1:73-1047(+)
MKDKPQKWDGCLEFGAFGIISGLGFHLSGMDLPQRTLRFFTVPEALEGKWDYSLLITFASAFLTHFLIYYAVRMAMSKPLFSHAFSIPGHMRLDKRLLLGSCLFGIGWGISGQCPGPAFTAFNRFQISSLVYAIAVFIGFIATEQHTNNYTLSDYINSKSHIYGGAAFLIFGTWTLLGLFMDSPVGPDPSPYLTATGGALIGLSIGLAMLFHGKILGNSGMLKGLVSPGTDDKPLRLSFLAGIVVSGTVAQFVLPGPKIINPNPEWMTFVGGLLVGMGTSMANGCTSGHGICGMARFSKRSIVATCTFFVFCGLTASLRSILKF